MKKRDTTAKPRPQQLVNRLYRELIETYPSGELLSDAEAYRTIKGKLVEAGAYGALMDAGVQAMVKQARRWFTKKRVRAVCDQFDLELDVPAGFNLMSAAVAIHNATAAMFIEHQQNLDENHERENRAYAKDTESNARVLEVFRATQADFFGTVFQIHEPDLPLPPDLNDDHPNLPLQ
jgi:hypothetical protein